MNILVILGYYCSEGTTEPFGCPPGTFGASDGLTNSSECTPCHPGKYCEQYANTANEGKYLFIKKLNLNVNLQRILSIKYVYWNSTLISVGDCVAGYYCPVGSINARQLVCPVGHFCPTGTGEPEGCPTVCFFFFWFAQEIDWFHWFLI